jgi:outer membrane protein assembly factor BamB
MVNLIVCSREFDLSRDEILRVLCPGGVALVREGRATRKLTKSWPDSYDEWTHYLNGPDNNAVSKDSAITAPLKHLQWKGSPAYSRHHDKSSSVPAAVTAGGKVFYIIDDGPRASILWAPKWQLAARDAFNGIVLWRKDIKQWTSHLWPLKSGPSVTPRRLVALGDSVYTTLGLLSPVSKLDAANGDELHTYAGTERTEEIICKDGVLYLVVNPDIDPKQRGGFWVQSPRRLMAVKESDGTILWRQQLAWIAPCTMAVGAERVFVSDGSRIVAFDPQKGGELWKSDPLPGRPKMPTYFAPTLVAVPGGVLYAGGENWKEHAGSLGLMILLDAETGRIRWQRPHLPSGYQSPQDIFVIGNRVWCGSLNSKPGEFDRRYPDVAPSTGEFVSYNLRTGEPDKSIPRGADCYWFHHRCHRAKATENFFLTSRTGIEMIDTRSGQWSLHHWVRGACVYGIMPANGLIYAPPHPCACYPEAKLTGFNALSGTRGRTSAENLRPAQRLLKGPAYGDYGPAPSSADWPTFRSDPARSGSTDVAVPTDLATRWQATIGGRLSQPVVAAGKVFVAAVDNHALYAIDRDSGIIQWRYIAGGRIDSPPTIHKGMAIFGSADGYVYCLRASDGALAWRLLAAPYDRRIMSCEQLESVWPVHGSILIRNDVAYVLAGRSMFLDGGMTLYRLDPMSGTVLSATRMDENDPGTGENLHTHVTMLDMPVASADILTSEGDYLFMRSQPFDLSGKRERVEHIGIGQQRGDDSHLFVPNGFLDDNWWHRAFWVYGRSVHGGPGYSQTGHATPSGKIMVLDEDNLYVFGRRQTYWRWTTATEYRLFSVDRSLPRAMEQTARAKNRNKSRVRAGQYETRWSVEMPVLVRAMVKAGDIVFAAGPKDIVDEESAFKNYDEPGTQEDLKKQAELFGGKEGSVLRAVSAGDGSKLHEIELDVLPVFDGMIAAGGELFLATVDGKVVCLTSRK